MILIKEVDEDIERKEFAFFYGEGVVSKEFGGGEFFRKGFGVGDDHAVAFVVQKFVDDFRTEFDVGIVNLFDVVRAAIGGREVVDALFFQWPVDVIHQLFDVMVEESGGLAVGKDEQVVVAEVGEKRGDGEGQGGTVDVGQLELAAGDFIFEKLPEFFLFGRI